MSDSSGVPCQPGPQWHNWAETIDFTPAVYSQPTTRDQLRQVLQQAQAEF